MVVTALFNLYFIQDKKYDYYDGKKFCTIRINQFIQCVIIEGCFNRENTWNIITNVTLN